MSTFCTQPDPTVESASDDAGADARASVEGIELAFRELSIYWTYM